MIAVAVKELKNRLSAYLREVGRGEVVLVTDRGRVVAELRQPSVDRTVAAADRELLRLTDQGELALGLEQDPQAYRRTPVRHTVGSSALLEAERAER